MDGIAANRRRHEAIDQCRLGLGEGMLLDNLQLLVQFRVECTMPACDQVPVLVVDVRAMGFQERENLLGILEGDRRR